MSQALHPMSEAEYLAWEVRQEVRHEFDGVRPRAMNGGTLGHEMIQGNLKFALMSRLRGQACRVFGPTARVPTGQGRYRYPDAVVTCTPPDPQARDVADPIVIFEILSETTIDVDRRTKLLEYRGLSSLVRYVMLEQTAALATVITRVPGHWRIDVLRAGEALDMPEIGVALPLAEIYSGIELPSEEGA